LYGNHNQQHSHQAFNGRQTSTFEDFIKYGREHQNEGCKRPGNQTWDFSTLLQHVEDTIVPIHPDSTNHKNDFPKANLAHGTKDSANYQANNNNALCNLGFGGYNTRVGSDIIFKFDKPDTITHFPIMYNSNNTDTVKTHGMGILYTNANGYDIKVRMDFFRNQVSNAWGKVTTPVKEYDAIRVYDKMVTFDSIWVDIMGNWNLVSDTSITSHIYTFWTDDQTVKYPLITVQYDIEQDTVINTKWILKSVELDHTAISNIEDKTINLYPNPTQNIVNVSTNNIIKNINIIDIRGAVVLTSNKKQINVSSLPKGLYFVKVQTDKGTSNKKILIQ